MQTLLIGSGNAGKVREIRGFLEGLSLRLDSLADHPGVSPPPEGGGSYGEIARGKALQISRETGLPTLGDDSGLEVEVLDGAPGIHSARYGGPGASEGDRISKLLKEMAARGATDSPARFCCSLAVALPGEVLFVVEGECRGWISGPPRGEGGFGYDPIFTPEGFDRTFAELPGETKNEVSHRGRALRLLRPRLAELLARRDA